ncbi:MAG: hypothetical protein HKN50_08870 [Gammaproteobacteria bacterium]|nr:hypothetical protein [Gammaproteobacteria bacterium]
MAEIYCFRHGQASFEADDYDQLSDIGYFQGELLGRHLLKSGIRFDRIYSGTLKRQIQTAEAVCAVYRSAQQAIPEIQQDARWNELESELQVDVLAPLLAAEDPQVGEWIVNARRDKKAFQKLIRATFSHWQQAGDSVPGLESWPTARQRVTEVLADVRQANGSGARTGVFTSGGIIAIVASQVLGLPETSVYGMFEKVINGSITRLLHNSSEIALSTFNEHSYLQAIADHQDVDRVITYR